MNSFRCLFALFRIHCDYIDPMWIFWPYSQKHERAAAVRAKTHNWMLKNACQLIRLVVVPFFSGYSSFSFLDDDVERKFDAGRIFSLSAQYLFLAACAKWLRKIWGRENYFIIDNFSSCKNQLLIWIYAKFAPRYSCGKLNFPTLSSFSGMQFIIHWVNVLPGEGERMTIIF